MKKNKGVIRDTVGWGKQGRPNHSKGKDKAVAELVDLMVRGQDVNTDEIAVKYKICKDWLRDTHKFLS